jgi:hypothetical protein
MSRLGSRRYEGFDEAHRFNLPEPSRIYLPDGPPERSARRIQRERDIAGVAPPARVHRPRRTALTAGDRLES